MKGRRSGRGGGGAEEEGKRRDKGEKIGKTGRSKG